MDGGGRQIPKKALMASQITSHPAAAHTLLRVSDATDPDAPYARPTGSLRGRPAYPLQGAGQAPRTYTAKSLNPHSSLFSG